MENASESIENTVFQEVGSTGCPFCCSLNYALGFFAILAVLFIVKRYCAGGRCHFKNDMSGQIAVITGANSGIGF